MVAVRVWNIVLALHMNITEYPIKRGNQSFFLMWLLYLADNHMYSVAYQQHCTPEPSSVELDRLEACHSAARMNKELTY
jgi:hypothetical protein